MINDLFEQLFVALKWVAGGFLFLLFSFLLVYSVSFAYQVGRRAGLGHKLLSEKKNNGED